MRAYSGVVTTKQKPVQTVLENGHSIDEFSLYRTKNNVLNCVERDLDRFQPGDNRQVFFCTTCDPCATEEQADITTSAIKLIMESSDLQVRVLSKSVLIMNIASELEGFRNRITYSLSTGTIRPEISACIEGNASPIEERIKTLKQLQDNGFRTYGMLCPILPSEMDKLDILIDEINPKGCEYIWAEAINVRGKSLVATREQLIKCELTEDAEAIGNVMVDKKNWQNYSKELFLDLQSKMKKRGLLQKFRFLQYVKNEPAEFKKFFENQEGAVCL
jgi:DNA repair photolyase